MAVLTKNTWHWQMTLPHILVLVWISFLGVTLWQHAVASVQLPICDSSSYHVKAFNFWQAVKQHHVFNPLNVEPTARPPGTVLVSYPFGFNNSIHGFWFRTVFLPLLSLVISLYWVVGRTDLRRRGWTVLAVILLLTAMPMFFSFDLNEGIPANTWWGLVDNFQSGLAALAMGAAIRSFSRRSVPWLLLGAFLAGLTLMVKPSGVMVMGLLGLGWLVLLVSESFRQWRTQGGLAKDLKRYAVYGFIGSVGIYSIFIILVLSSSYLSKDMRDLFKTFLPIQKEILRIPLLEYFPVIYRTTGVVVPALVLPSLIICLVRSWRKQDEVTARISAIALPTTSILCWVLGCYLWLVVQEGGAVIRYFHPFLLMGLVALLPAILDLWESAPFKLRAVAMLLCVLSAANIAALLIVPKPPVAWQTSSGVNVTSGNYGEATNDAYRFLRTLKDSGRVRLYTFEMDSYDVLSFLAVGDYEAIVHPENPGFASVYPMDWVQGLAVRLPDVVGSDYLVIKDFSEAQAQALLTTQDILSFELEARVIQAWLGTNASRAGVTRILRTQTYSIFKVVDRVALRASLLQLVATRNWRAAVTKSAAQLTAAPLYYAKDIVLGDRYGTLSSYAERIFFIHPGLTTPTIFDFEAAAYVHDANRDKIRLSARMDSSRISPEKVAPGGGKAHLLVQVDGKTVFDQVISVGHPFTVDLVPGKDGLIHINVDNAGVANANFLLLGIDPV